MKFASLVLFSVFLSVNVSGQVAANQKPAGTTAPQAGAADEKKSGAPAPGAKTPAAKPQTPAPATPAPVKGATGAESQKIANVSKPAARKTPAPKLTEVKKAIAGDFCQKDENCNCTTTLLKPGPAGHDSCGVPDPGTNSCSLFPQGRARCVASWPDDHVVHGYVEDASGNSSPVTTLESLGPDAAIIDFTAAADFKPASVILYTSSSAYTFPYSEVTNAAAKPNPGTPTQIAASGDFCQKDENCICTTALLKPAASVTGNQCASYPRGRSVDDWKFRRNKITASVQDAAGANQKATLLSLGVDAAVLSFSAPSGFKPATLLLYTADNAYPFPYVPAPPLEISNLNYGADDLSAICDLYSIPLNPAAAQTCGNGTCKVTLQDPYVGAVGDRVSVTNAGDQVSCYECEITDIDTAVVTYSSPGNFTGTLSGAQLTSPALNCVNTKPEHLQIKPLTLGSEVTLDALTDKLLVARVKAPMGSEPNALLVTNTNACGAQPPATCGFPPRSTIARRLIKPAQNTRLLNVDMTIMDQVTAQRNYGNRIAKRYIAVTLDVKNPTSQKVQFNKSALYFDVDYVESRERPVKAVDWFWEPVKEGVTLGLYQPSVYKPPFVASGKDDKPPRVARFGIEQNVKHAPVNYLSALGSFDYTTTKTDEDLRYLELIGSVLSNIATGGLVSDASGAFRAGTSVFAGTFLPGVRSLVLPTSFINRLRSNLVAQTLQETVQVSPGGSATTIVLLPRAGILSFLDADVAVMVNRVIDVHLDEEVVTPVNGTSVKKGECTQGNSKEQTRQALGEPTGVTTNADGSSAFTYPKGPVSSASFKADGTLLTCHTRTAAEQLDQTTTLTEALQILDDLKLTSTKLALTDGSTILVDIPGIQTIYRFDSKGKRLPDYTLLFDAIKAEKGAKKSDFDAFLEDKAKALQAKRSADIGNQAKGFNKQSFATTSTYDSPDLVDGKIEVKFSSGAKETKVDEDSLVESITFSGLKPSNIN